MPNVFYYIATPCACMANGIIHMFRIYTSLRNVVASAQYPGNRRDDSASGHL